MRRTLVLIALVALAACNKPPAKADADASGAAPSSLASSSAEAASGAKPAHNWATENDKQYLYYSHTPAEGGAPGEVVTTTIRYMGQATDGSYVVAEVEGGAVVLASCTLPCTSVRLRGQGLDQTVPLGGDSVVKMALNDAIAGQLEVYPLPQRPKGQ